MIVNGSFELGSFVQNYTTNAGFVSPGESRLTGWHINSAPIAWKQTGNIWGLNASTGNRFIDLNGQGNLGTISQSVNFSSNGAYLLTFDLGSDNRWDPNFTLGVFFNNQLVNSFNNRTSNAYDVNPNDGAWTAHRYSFTADISTIDISFKVIGTSGQNYYVGLDNIQLTQTDTFEDISEPPIALLITLIIGGILVYRANKSSFS